jgi:CDP-diacylglycerol--glycerol-3-phosphate 3-phosphatidyltransferase
MEPTAPDREAFSDDRPSGGVPRIADVPAPRRTKGGLGPLFAWAFDWPYRFLLAGLYRAGVRPWQLTALSLVANVVIGWLIISGHFFVPGLLLIAAGLLDIFDGGVARLRGEASRWGAFLDSVVDRISDLVLFGCIYWALSGQGERLGAALALTSLIATLLVSHIRAEAEAAALELTEGLMQRLERYVALMVALIVPRAMVPVLAILTVLGFLTAIQRLWVAWRQTRPAAAVHRTEGRREEE